MFGHDSLPSRVFSFGALAPTENLGLVDEQMRRAHRYRNKLVEIELLRRSEVEALVSSLSEPLQKIDARVEHVGRSLEIARKQIKTENARARKRVADGSTARTLREELKRLRVERKTLRKEIFGSLDFKRRQAKINADDLERRKEARASGGLYWGTYLHVEQSMAKAKQGAPPRFKRWRGDGHLAVQLQTGASIQELCDLAETRIRVEPIPKEAWLDNKRFRRRMRRTVVRFRVGSDGKSPIFAVVPVETHRRIPDDAQVKWVHLLRVRVATRYVWKMQFVVARACGWPRNDLAAAGTVSIDVGWRVRDDGSLRVAYWVGSDGHEGELVLSCEWRKKLRKADDLRSIRDKLLNGARDVIAEWIRGRADLPDWMLEARKTLRSWRSPARLAVLCLKWRENRFAEDWGAFDALEAWRKRDKHLYLYEAGRRRRCQNNRLNLYRHFARDMRRAYAEIRIESLDLRDFHELPEPEEKAADPALRENVRDACLHELLESLKQSGAKIAPVDPKDTTRKCPRCGAVSDFDRKGLIKPCPCGYHDDQDRVAAQNISSAPVT